VRYQNCDQNSKVLRPWGFDMYWPRYTDEQYIRVMQLQNIVVWNNLTSFYKYISSRLWLHVCQTSPHIWKTLTENEYTNQANRNVANVVLVTFRLFASYSLEMLFKDRVHFSLSIKSTISPITLTELKADSVFIMLWHAHRARMTEQSKWNSILYLCRW
jgi:hypothetical protein